jgi:hypothetical protein
MSDIERDIDPPEPTRYDHIRIKKYWIEVEWEDGYRETIDAPKDIPQLDAFIDEIEYEANCDILENQAQKYGDPDSDY